MNFLILSRSNAKKFSYKKQEKPYIIISITDIASEKVVFNKSSYLKSVLRLNFDDVDTECDNAISDADAEKIVNFVTAWKNEVDLIVVHCEAGVSRSAGVCAALMLWLNDSDEPIFTNPFYKPNMKCYRTVLNQILKLQEKT